MSDYDDLITLSWQVNVEYLDKAAAPGLIVRLRKLLETETDDEKIGYINRNIISLEEIMAEGQKEKDRIAKLGQDLIEEAAND